MKNLKASSTAFRRHLLPGLVLMAVMVAGGYSTGREVVEFFVSKGPATGLLGMAMTCLIMGPVTMIAFELARQYRAFDYQTFTVLFLGRAALLFELGYFAFLLLILSVMTSAASNLGESLFGSPPLLNSLLFIGAVAGLLFYGSSLVERLISAWAAVFLCVIAVILVLVLLRFGGRLAFALRSTSIDYRQAATGAALYSGYNIIIMPVCMYVARHFESRADALTAGALAGILILIPGVALVLALSASYPAVLAAPIPISLVLQALDVHWLTLLVQLVILTALLKSAVGMLHGMNERVARTVRDRGGSLRSWVRVVLALSALIIAVFFSASFGIIELIKHGYRFSAYYFWAIFLLPLLTRGVSLIIGHRQQALPRES